MLVAVSVGGIIISGVVVATGIISGVVVATGIISGVEVAMGGVVVATGSTGVVGTGSLAGIIAAAVPGFVVAPHAPSEVFITPPSIYIHFGAAVALLKNIKFIAEEE